MIMEKLSIIMPFLNELDELQNTIDSIYETTNPSKFEIIVIDDCSDKKSEIKERKEIRIIRNKTRIGVDACRQLGSELATYDNLCFFDAHMRFPLGWSSRMLENIQSEPETLWCTMCMGLGYGNMDLNKSRDRYRAADIVLLNASREVLEPKWRSVKNEGKYEVPCVLGANYGVNKKWFEHIHGLKGLQMWGCSEMFMSLKTWFAGGTCKIDTDIKIGHKFRDNAPYSTNVWNLIYNKIYMIKTILPEDLGNYLIESMPQTSSYKRAIKEIQDNLDIIESERNYYSSIFTKDIFDVGEKWDVPIHLFVKQGNGENIIE